MADLHHYQVGHPYSPGVSHWPETPQFNHRMNSTELVLFYASPSPAEVEEIRSAPAEFALYVERDLLVVLYRFGDSPWSDAPYSWHLVPEDQRTLPNLTGLQDPHLILVVMLVDAATGILLVNRVVSLAPSFSTALSLAIREQASRPWPGDVAYDRQLAALYQRYPASRDMVRHARARSRGGS